MNAKRWGPDFLRDLHTRHAKHNEVLGLKRGEPRPDTRHKPLKEYYRELEVKEAEFIKATKSEQEKTRLLWQARNYIKAAKEVMDQQFNNIIELIDIATNHDLTGAETERVNKIAASAMKGRSVGASPHTPNKRDLGREPGQRKRPRRALFALLSRRSRSTNPRGVCIVKVIQTRFVSACETRANW